MIEKSPTLKDDISKLTNNDWTISFGKEGSGSQTIYTAKEIILDGNLKKSPATTVQILSHEIGHQQYSIPADMTSKEAYIHSRLANEAAATMKNIHIQREIISNGGIDIGIAGNPSNHQHYNKAYDQFLKTKDAEASRKSIGSIISEGEITSTTKQPYSIYYGEIYDKAVNKK